MSINHLYIMDGLLLGGQEATLFCVGPKRPDTEKQVRVMARDLVRGYKVSVKGEKK